MAGFKLLHDHCSYTVVILKAAKLNIIILITYYYY